MEKMTMARGAAARAKVQLTMCPRDYVTRSTKLLCRIASYSFFRPEFAEYRLDKIRLNG